ncbi:nickel pincer cofactor biosynthesis protein LarC [Nitrosopumilus sp. Nsub]|uniref:nickel pincer cofactor biosynthesis protein LarC n=1 Tax=Nitrosopumilus sp. Nsub TaxID=1776294 RepID=UPI000835818E|nr:nickel pincer cofactor biosynthesis protein LarC [Nitrosopumilus sp. Nsub]
MVIVIDPQIAGISGDMILCSLIDLGVDKNEIINGIKKIEKFLPNSKINKIDFQKIQKHGIESTELILEVDENVSERKGIEVKDAIINSVKELQLSDKAKSFAESCINSLISSESKIHGTSEDSVHFHEASSIDTLIDIVGVTLACDKLRFFDEKIVCLPVSVGSGTVSFSHGTMSNPASAVLQIFKNSNLMIKGNNANEELTTPTGACILVNLTNDSVEYYPSLNINSVGYGAGQKNFELFSNVLKIVQGSQEKSHMDSVKILETNVDDVSGEILGYLIEKIMKVGAKDISIYPGITKKGRPTNLISVICDDEKIDVITDILVLETGTLGIRISDSNRLIVSRTNHSFSLTFEGKSFEINYKKSIYRQKTHFKIEFEDLKNIAETLDKPIRDVEVFLRKEIEKIEDP